LFGVLSDSLIPAITPPAELQLNKAPFFVRSENMFIRR